MGLELKGNWAILQLNRNLLLSLVKCWLSLELLMLLVAIIIVLCLLKKDRFILLGMDKMGSWVTEIWKVGLALLRLKASRNNV